MNEPITKVFGDYETEYPNYRTEEKNREVLYRGGSGQTVKHQKVPMCGHDFVPETEPSHKNCEACWFAFFSVYGELTKSLDELHKKGEAYIIQRLKGTKFLSMFRKYMSTLAAYQAAASAAQEKVDVSSIGSPEAGNEQRASRNSSTSEGESAAEGEGGE